MRTGIAIALIGFMGVIPLPSRAQWVSSGEGTVYTMPEVDKLTDDVTWREEGYYHISGDLTISANDRLIIDSGMVLKFELGLGLTVNGALEARGNPDEMIVFTDAGGEWPWTSWRGMTFNDTSVDSECVLKYCVVEHTGNADGVMIRISNASPTVSHCKLMWTSSLAEPGGTLVACDSASFPVIEQSLLRSHLGVAVCSWWRDSPSIPLLLENDIIFNDGFNSGPHTIIGGGFLDGNYLECWGHVDNSLGSPVDTVGDENCTTTSTDPIAPQFWLVDGVRSPRSRPHSQVPYQNESVVPEFFALGQNYPNPFNASTSIPYKIPRTRDGRAYVTLRIYNILGQIVRTLVDEPHSPGEHGAIWDGRDGSGREMASGIYLCRLTAENGRGSTIGSVRKLIMTR